MKGNGKHDKTPIENELAKNEVILEALRELLLKDSDIDIENFKAKVFVVFFFENISAFRKNFGNDKKNAVEILMIKIESSDKDKVSVDMVYIGKSDKSENAPLGYIEQGTITPLADYIFSCETDEIIAAIEKSLAAEGVITKGSPDENPFIGKIPEDFS